MGVGFWKYCGSLLTSRWVLGVMGVFGVQLGFIFLLSERMTEGGDGDPDRKISLIGRGVADGEREVGWAGNLALVHPLGFSKGFWDGVPERRWERPRVEPLEERAWLMAYQERLGSGLSGYLDSEWALRLSFKSKLPLKLEVEGVGEGLLISGSWVSVAGEIAERAIVKSPSLPSIPSLDWVSESVVEVGVDGGGYPVVRRLVGKSGSSETDSLAVRLSREFRFEARDGMSLGEMTWGKLVFHWHTEEP